MIKTAEEELQDKMEQADCLMWCHRRKIQLSDGVPFELLGRPYLKDIVNCDKKIMSVKNICIVIENIKFVAS